MIQKRKALKLFLSSSICVLLSFVEVSGFLVLYEHQNQNDVMLRQKKQQIGARKKYIHQNGEPQHALRMAIVPPSDDSTVGVLGRGYVSVLLAKLSALKGYKTWMICPSGQEDIIQELIGNHESPCNVEMIPTTDTDTVRERIGTTDALMISVDDDAPIDNSVVDFVLDPEIARKLKRVVVLSRNLNGKDMGFFVKASKMSANAEVWDNGNAALYKQFESCIKKLSKKISPSTEYTIVRAGTLKGGGGSENNIFPQYLSDKFYEMTHRDIINWQFLFDCETRGVTLAKGDVMPGPGAKAVFTATATDANPGDTGRCAIAEAMVRSLNIEAAGNVDFGIGTEEAREPPTDEQWTEIFSALK